jgi:hypothetical protein
MAQAAAIDGFEKTRAEVAVNPHGQTDDLVSQISIVVEFEVHAADPIA